MLKNEITIKSTGDCDSIKDEEDIDLKDLQSDFDEMLNETDPKIGSCCDNSSKCTDDMKFQCLDVASEIQELKNETNSRTVMEVSTNCEVTFRQEQMCATIQENIQSAKMANRKFKTF